jgi:histidine triad (HIT) family protein
VQLIASAVQSAMGAEGTFVAMNNRVSQSVPHLHVHVVPRKKGDGLKGFFWPRTKYKSPAEMVEVGKLIADRIKGSWGDVKGEQFGNWLIQIWVTNFYMFSNSIYYCKDFLFVLQK